MDSTRGKKRQLRRIISAITGNRAKPLVASALCLITLVVIFDRLQVGQATSTVVAVSGADPMAAPRQGFVQGQRPSQVSEVETVTITPRGFQPESLTRTPGLFILAYDNCSDLSVVSPQIDTVAGAPVHRLSLKWSARSWMGEFDLPPGKYVITEPSHPDWSCVLSVN